MATQRQKENSMPGRPDPTCIRLDTTCIRKATTALLSTAQGPPWLMSQPQTPTVSCPSLTKHAALQTYQGFSTSCLTGAPAYWARLERRAEALYKAIHMGWKWWLTERRGRTSLTHTHTHRRNTMPMGANDLNSLWKFYTTFGVQDFRSWGSRKHSLWGCCQSSLFLLSFITWEYATLNEKGMRTCLL